MPDLKPPEECWDFTYFVAADPDISDQHLARMARARAFEIRSYRPSASAQATQHYQWFRVAAPIGDDPLVHRGFLAFASDMGLLSSAMLPHEIGRASCRARVCQYGEIPVVAGSLSKKKTRTKKK